MRFLAATLVIAAVLGSTAHAQKDVVRERSDQAMRFLAWVTAVRSHAPGAVDQGAREVATWTQAMLNDMAVELANFRILMRSPKTSTFSISVGGKSPQSIYYNESALRRMREAAADLVERRVSDIDLVEQAAVLHTDLAFHPEILATPVEAFGGSGRALLLFGDGAQLGVGETADHLDVARKLLQLIPRGNTHDDDIRRWYEGTLARQQAIQFWDTEHTEAALEAFPDAPELQFLAGCLHEVLASAAIRAVVERASLPGRAVLRVDDERDELRKAAAAFARALQLRPDFAEARIHHGHVRTRLGQLEPALSALRGVDDARLEPALRYYAAMFLGDAAEAAGRRDEAGAAYTRALGLFGSSRSPRLALSYLAWQGGDRSAAQMQLESILTTREDADTDPMWRYPTFQARDADVAFADAEARLTQPGPPLKCTKTWNAPTCE